MPSWWMGWRLPSRNWARGQARNGYLRQVLNGRRCIDTVARDICIDALFELRGNLVAEANIFGKVVGEGEPVFLNSSKSP